jgi:hypothetical protein
VTSRRKQRIVSVILTAIFVPAITALFVYLFATGSPDAVPLLLVMVGSVAGVVLVYLVDRVLRTRSTSAGRWVRGIALVGMCVAGFAVNAATPFDSTLFQTFVKGFGFGSFSTAFLVLMIGVLLPPEPSTRAGR